MASFKDRSGRRWQITLDADLARRIKEDSGFDLTQPREFMRLAGDLGSGLAVLWWLCRSQAEPRGIDRDEFFRIIGGCVEGAIDALISAAEAAFPDAEETYGFSK